jgi:hypothetical protein
MKPFISKTFHGVINYVGAILLMASPWLFNFSELKGAAILVPLYFGWLQLIMAIFSDNPLGFIKVFPMQMHNCLDVFSGSFLLMLPITYGFCSQVFWPHFLLGSLFFLSGIFTVESPFLTRPHRSLPEAGITSIDSHDGRLNV